MSAADSTFSRRPPPRTAFVTGANGYIGSAVSRAFTRAGWRVFGLVRRTEATLELELNEVIPIVGKLDDLHWVPGLLAQTKKFDVIVNCLEAFPDYKTPYGQLVHTIALLAESSNRHGVRPLVLWSSGCKDYGLGALHGDPELVSHTEESPLNAPVAPLLERATTSLEIFNHKDIFDAVILRPTTLYGFTSSYYGNLFDYASAEFAKGSPSLRIPVDPNVPMHGTHIDDCAEAYVSLAEHPDRIAISGQCFNISAHRYETVGEICNALAVEYGFPQGAQFMAAEDAGDWFPRSLLLTLNFPQWVSSDKIRELTGWKDKRMLFWENVGAYRLSYEAQKRKGHENIGLLKERMKTMNKVDIQRD